MVSHDRAFLDNVVTSTLVFEGEGRVREYVGGYEDWIRQGGSPKLLGVAESKGGKAELGSAVVEKPAEQRHRLQTLRLLRRIRPRKAELQAAA